MKIGIVTASLGSNIGGILQNFALQQTLKKLGHYPITIDHGKKYTRFRWFVGRVRNLFNNSAKTPPFPRYDRIGTGNILRFVFKNINLTRFMTSINAKVITDNKLDAILVGSDQVWRKEYNNLYETYLGFAKDYDIKKISYAASFGTESWEYNAEQTKTAKNLIGKFAAVSVREESDVALCNKYLNVDATWVLDPTLLLDCDNYMKLCKDVPYRNKAILFAYLLDLTEEKIIFLHKMSERLGCELIFKSAENNLSSKDTIENWLSLFRDSTYVITDSYHGTLFSIIFHKKFLTIANKKRGMSRFKSILNLIRQDERLIYNLTEYTHIEDEINWSEVDSTLFKKKEQSMQFLSSALSC